MSFTTINSTSSSIVRSKPNPKVIINTLNTLETNKNFYKTSAFTLIDFFSNGGNGPTVSQKIYQTFTAGTTNENGEYSVCSFCTDHSTQKLHLLVDGNDSTFSSGPVTNTNGITYNGTFPSWTIVGVLQYYIFNNSQTLLKNVGQYGAFNFNSSTRRYNTATSGGTVGNYSFGSTSGIVTIGMTIYSTSASSNEVLYGDYIDLITPCKIKLNSYTIRTISTTPNGVPKNYSLFGSNTGIWGNDDDIWYLIGNYTNTNTTASTNITVNPQETQTIGYKKIRMVINSINGTGGVWQIAQLNMNYDIVA